MTTPHDDAIAKAYDSQLMRRLLTYLRPYKGRVALAFGLILIMSLLDLAGPYFTKIAIDDYIATGDGDGLLGIVALYGLVLVAAFVVRFGQVYVLSLTGQYVMVDMRRQIFGHLQKLHVGYFDKNPVGRLMTRVTTDVDALNELFTSGVVAVFGDLFTLLGIMGVMLALNWRLALVTFAVLPFFFAITVWFRQGARSGFREIRRWLAQINAFLQENLTGMTVVQLFRREKRQLEEFERVNRQHTTAHLHTIFYYAVFYPVIDLLAALAVAAIILYGGNQVLSSVLTLGVLVAFIQYTERFWRPISDLSEKFNIMQAAMASSERIFALLDTEPGITAPAKPIHLDEREGTRRLRGRLVRLRRGRLGARGRQLRRRARGEAGPRRRHGGRQDDDHQPAAASLRRDARAGDAGRSGHPRAGSRRAARLNVAGAPGRTSVQRHDRLQRPARLAHLRRKNRSRGQGRAHRSLRGVTPRDSTRPR